MQRTSTNLRTLLPFLSLALAPGLLAQDKVSLKINAKKGDVFWFVESIKNDQNIDMGGQQMEMSQDIKVTLSVEIGDRSDKGELSATAQAVRIEGKMTLPMMGEVEFDSAKPDEGDDNDASGFGLGNIGKSVTSLVGKTFTVKVDAGGDVLEVKGIDAALKDARGKAGGMGSQMLGGLLNDGILKRMMGMTFGAFPAEPTAVGAEWKKDREVAGTRGMDMSTVVTMKLVKADDEAVELGLTGTVSKRGEAKKDDKDAKGGKKEADDEGDENAAMQREMMAKMKIENGKLTGSSRIARKDGMVVKSSTTMSMDMTMPSPMGGDMSIAYKSVMTAERTTAEAAKPKTEAKKAKDDKKEEKKDEKAEPKKG